MASTAFETRDELTRRRFLDRAWRAFVTDGVEVEGVDAAILHSWRRARDKFRIDPAQRRCSRMLATEEIESRREQDWAYRLALPLLHDFAARLAPSQNVLAFFDAAGWMLSLDGDPGTASRVAEINFCPGANWSEESVGTNGPGTALSEGRPVEVFASAHFVEAWQYWSCSAAPIVAPDTGEVLGVVDITGPWSSHELQAMVAVRAIAQAVEERLRAARMVRDQVVEYAFRTARSGGDGLVAIDHQGRVLAVNDALRTRLAFEGLAVPLPIREALRSSSWQAPGAEPRELAVDCAQAGTLRLQASPVRFDGQTVGAIVSVPAAARPAVSPVRSSALRSSAPAPAARYQFPHILGRSPAIARALQLARMAAGNDLPVVLCGESGTGKELFAQAIHSASARRDGPFVAVNCGCIPAALLEAEFFGYEPGTFTGGRREGNAGKFEEASGGTLFLDEVSELPLQAQTALLRVLQEHEVVRLGGSAPRRVDLRVIAASNKGLAEEIAAGRFRSDLFFRLNVLAIPIQPLRERIDDIAFLARAFLADAEVELGRAGLELSPEALQALLVYPWPGNARELRNAILRAAATAPGSRIAVVDLPWEVGAALGGHRPAPEPAEPARTVPLERVAAPRTSPGGLPTEREDLLRALGESSWNVARAAQLLRVSRMTLYRKLRKYGIERC